MLPTEFILTNHLDNYARPLKCLNDQGGNSLENKLLQYPIAFKVRPKMVAQHNTGDTYKLLISVFNTNTSYRINAPNNDSGSTSDWIAVGV